MNTRKDGILLTFKSFTSIINKLSLAFVLYTSIFTDTGRFKFANKEGNSFDFTKLFMLISLSHVLRICLINKCLKVLLFTIL